MTVQKIMSDNKAPKAYMLQMIAHEKHLQNEESLVVYPAHLIQEGMLNSF